MYVLSAGEVKGFPKEITAAGEYLDMVVLHLKQMCKTPALFLVILVGCVIYDGMLLSRLLSSLFLEEQQHPNTQHIID
jgi:hypothetical protein